MFIHVRSSPSKKRLRSKEWTPLRRVSLGLLAVGCLVMILVSAFPRSNWRGIQHQGKALAVWEKEAVARMKDGSYGQLIRPEVQKMRPETIPFWLERLQASGSLPARCYSLLWQILPRSVQTRGFWPIRPESRRQVIRIVLRDMMQSLVNDTNGISEVIRLSYSPDAELQSSAIELLVQRASLGFEPNAEYFEALCWALRAQSNHTRVLAVRGLSTPMDPRGLPGLRMALTNADEEVRVFAASALLKVGPSQALMRVFENAETSTNSRARALAQLELAISRRSHSRTNK